MHRSNILGIGCSLVTWPDTFPENLVIGDLDINVPLEYKSYSNVGIEHNEVIHSYFYLEQDINEYYGENFNEEQIKVLKSDIMNDAKVVLNNLSIEYVNNDLDFHQLTEELVAQELFTPNMKPVMDLFLEEYLSTKNPSEIEPIINFYIDEVANSELEEVEKKALISAFMVASQSPFYFYGG